MLHQNACYELTEIYKGFVIFFSIHQDGYQGHIISPFDDVPTPEDLSVGSTLEAAQHIAYKACDREALTQLSYAKVEDWSMDKLIDDEQMDQLFNMIHQFQNLGTLNAASWKSTIPSPKYQPGQLVCTASEEDLLCIGTVDEVRWSGLWEYMVNDRCFVEEELFSPYPKHWLYPARHSCLDYEITITKLRGDRHGYKIYDRGNELISSGPSSWCQVPTQAMYYAIQQVRKMVFPEPEQVAA